MRPVTHLEQGPLLDLGLILDGPMPDFSNSHVGADPNMSLWGSMTFKVAAGHLPTPGGAQTTYPRREGAAQRQT